MKFHLTGFVFAGLVLASSVVAEDLPRWKFAAGDRLRYEVQQETELEVKAGKAGETSSFAMQTLDVVWHVDEVDDSGTMTGTQRVERIRLSIRQPLGQEIEYDSDSEEAPEAFAAVLTPLYEALLATEVPISVTSLGEVTSCEVPEELAERIAGMPANKTTRDFSAAVGVQKLAEQIALLLPEKEGEPSKRPMNATLGVLGNMQAEIAWQLDESEESMAKFKPQMEISLEGPIADIKPKAYSQLHPLKSTSIDSKEVDGAADFNTELGRLESLKLELKLAMSGKLFGNEVKNELRQLIRVKRKQ